MPSKTEFAPNSLYRDKEGLGRWEHSGKVAAVGVGHSPADRRWDGRQETSVGAYAIIALRKAIEDAGIRPDEVDGLVMDSGTTTGNRWEESKPLPEDFVKAFKPGADFDDGISHLSTEWILANMPELTNIQFT